MTARKGSVCHIHPSESSACRRKRRKRRRRTASLEGQIKCAPRTNSEKSLELRKRLRRLQRIQHCLSLRFRRARPHPCLCLFACSCTCPCSRRGLCTGGGHHHPPHAPRCPQVHQRTRYPLRVHGPARPRCVSTHPRQSGCPRDVTMYRSYQSTTQGGPRMSEVASAKEGRQVTSNPQVARRIPQTRSLPSRPYASIRGSECRKDPAVKSQGICGLVYRAGVQKS